MRSPLPRRRLARTALAAGAFAALLAPLAAQADAPLRGSALLARLRADDLGVAEASTLVKGLVAEPVTLRLQAAEVLRAVFAARGKRHDKRCQELAGAIAAALAPAPGRAAKKAAFDPAPTRAKSLALSRTAGLTKQTIEQEIDPLLAQLEAELWTAHDALCAREPRLATDFAALQRERGELLQWHTLFGQSVAGLELHPDVEKHFVKRPPPPAPCGVASLDDEWIVWTLLALPISARDRRTLEANETLRAVLDPQELAGTTALNKLRFLLGLPCVRIDEKLTRAARDHSADMELLGFFDHTSPVPGKRTPSDRAARFGTSGGAENIANGHDSGPSAIRGWWYSPGHHRNMLGDHARTGLGRSGVLWTQMFGG